MKHLLKSTREKRGLLIREVAGSMGIDASLVSKFESGTRKPTKDQVIALASILDIDTDELIVAWLSERILYEIGDDELVIKAMRVAEKSIGLKRSSQKKEPIPEQLRSILDEIDVCKKNLELYRKFDSYRIKQALELEYTFESNRIEGNTLTLKETDLVINDGITISGKSMREHLEAINHTEAISFIKQLLDKEVRLRERDVLAVHNIILRGIEPDQAGKYRSVQVMIKGSKHEPPQPFLVPKQMEDYFFWYEKNKNILHPVLLAAEMGERLVTIHPFIDGNGRTSRLVMNLILLRHGYVIANIKGDHLSRLKYYDVLERAQVEHDKYPYLQFIAETELESLTRYLKIIQVK